MGEIRRDVVGKASDYANPGNNSAAPMGGTDKGPSTKGRGAPKGNKMMNGGTGYFNAAPMANGMPVAAPLPMGDVSKGPQNSSIGPMGNITKGGNGAGRFAGKNQQTTGSAGVDFPNRGPGN
jgi:hypothetical protein